MKRLISAVLLVAVLSLFCMTSCTQSDNVCYYAFFGNTAFMLVYSEAKNTLYEINLPFESVLLWGKLTGTDSISTAIRSFAGLNEDGFLVGTPQVLTAVRDVLNALSPDSSKDELSRLEVLCSRNDILGNSQLRMNMNRLCNTDFSILADTLLNRNAEVRFFDSASFLSGDDLVKSRAFFVKWLDQVIGAGNER